MNSTNDGPAVSVDGLIFSYAAMRVLDEVALEVPTGEIFGLLGANGAGKTTLIRLLVGLLKPESGSVKVLGQTPSATRSTSVGYMPQLNALYEELSVEENVGFFARMYGMSDRSARREAVESALRLVGLFDRRSDLILRLSGGMRQRVSLAIALVHSPSVLLLDEPTVGLDPELRAVFWEHFREMSGGGTTLVISSHTMDDAAHCDRLAFLRGGRFVGDGSPEELRAATGRADASLEDAFLHFVRGRWQLVSVDRTLAIALRILRQISRDRRSLALIIVAPIVVMALVGFSFGDQQGVLDRIAPGLIAVFVLFFTFVLTGVSFLRERAQGTLERLLTTPVGRADILVGYTTGFFVLAMVQSVIVVTFTLLVLEVNYQGSIWQIWTVLVPLVVVGVSLGVFISTFARNEFQVVQFIPLLLAPQIFLSGVIAEVDKMPAALEVLAYLLPLTYAVDGLQDIMLRGDSLGSLGLELGVLALYVVALLTAAAVAVRRS